jgi:diaminopimelate decarboxylase/aspartate kinase
VQRDHPHLSLWLEPGRFLVAEAGVLLVTVTQVKEKQGTRFVGVDAGMHVLARPVLYSSWHGIANLTRIHAAPSEICDVVGQICEAGDVLGRARSLPPTSEGDVLLIETTGAYGSSMSSRYNLRRAADEILLPEGTAPAD